jgi:FK506-binding protein 2
LHINYTGTLTDGTVFDSSEGKKPLSFTLGAGQVIKGWDRGILGMCVGEVRKLQIPPELAYGESAMGKIPKNSVLIFEVELIKIEAKEEL